MRRKKGKQMRDAKYWLQKLHGAEFKVLRFNDAPLSTVTGDTPETIVKHLREKLPESPLYNPDVESLIVVFLSSRRKIIGFQIISTGILDTLLVHAREVFRPAIVMNASAIVVAHNHPSGDSTPSEADIKVTRDLIRAGQLLKIEVLDHVILGSATEEQKQSGKRDYASLRELGYFYS